MLNCFINENTLTIFRPSQAKVGWYCTEGCMREQVSLEFDLTFGDVLLHKLVQAY